MGMFDETMERKKKKGRNEGTKERKKGERRQLMEKGKGRRGERKVYKSKNRSY